MGEWLVGIVGVISLGLLLEILLPDGQTSKYVRGAFSLLVILVVISPIPKLLGGEYTLDLASVNYDIDLDFVKQTSSQYTCNLEDDLEKILKEQGIESVVEIVIKEGSVKDVDFVMIKIFLSRIDENQENTFINVSKDTVSKYLSIDKNNVEVSVQYGSG